MLKRVMLSCWMLIVLPCVADAQTSAAETPDVQTTGQVKAWQPERTWAFVVGVLEWKDGAFSAFPKTNRRDEQLVDVLKRRGVPEKQITYLQDQQATTSAVQAAFDEFLKKPREGDWVFFYFTGHGYNSADHQETYLASYDAGDKVGGIPVSPIPRMINRRSQASYVLLAVDNCNSGGIAEAVKNLKAPRAAFCALSSAHWNSGSTANWTFTENLIYAFSGEPVMDDDANGTVTFQELRANIVEDMTFAENQMPQSMTTPSFETTWEIAKSRTTPDRELGQRAEFLSQGNWYRGFTVAKEAGRQRVRFYGYAPGDDEWVTSEMIRQPVPKETLPVGQRVTALSMGNWYPGEIIAVRKGLHLIRFDGWSTEWNEWLPATKLKRE